MDRQYIAFKRNGPDMPAQAEMYPLIGLLDELQDKDRIEELFTAERAKNPALDAWFNEWFLSDYDADYFKRSDEGSLGHIFYRDVIEKNFEIIIYEKPRAENAVRIFPLPRRPEPRSGAYPDRRRLQLYG